MKEATEIITPSDRSLTQLLLNQISGNFHPTSRQAVVDLKAATIIQKVREAAGPDQDKVKEEAKVEKMQEDTAITTVNIEKETLTPGEIGTITER